MRRFLVRSTWSAEDMVELPDDVEIDDYSFTYLNRWPEGMADQVDANGAELVDWTVTEVAE